jgi:hypothetical protein
MPSLSYRQNRVRHLLPQANRQVAQWMKRFAVRAGANWGERQK